MDGVEFTCSPSGIKRDQRPYISPIKLPRDFERRSAGITQKKTADAALFGLEVKAKLIAAEWVSMGVYVLSANTSSTLLSIYI
jgi:hypothetical protein